MPEQPHAAHSEDPKNTLHRPTRRARHRRTFRRLAGAATALTVLVAGLSILSATTPATAAPTPDPAAGNPAIWFTSTPPAAGIVGSSYTPAIDSANLTGTVEVSVHSASGDACTLTGGQVTFDDAGVCILQAVEDTNAETTAPLSLQAINVRRAPSCLTYRDHTGETRDGTYPLAIGGVPVDVYCHQMEDPNPTEYLTLQHTGPDANYSHLATGGPRTGPEVTTRFTKVRLDPDAQQLITSDLTFATSTGGPLTDPDHADGFVAAGYGRASTCSATDPVGLNADLRGTGMGFRHNWGTSWHFDGHPAGGISFTANRQLMIVPPLLASPGECFHVGPELTASQTAGGPFPGIDVGASNKLDVVPLDGDGNPATGQDLTITTVRPPKSAVYEWTGPLTTTGQAPGNEVTYTGVGNCTVERATGRAFAGRAGTCAVIARADAVPGYLPATPAVTTRQFVNHQVLGFTSTLDEAAVGDSYRPVVAGGGSIHPIQIWVDYYSENVCRLEADGTVTFLTSGTCELLASQPGDINHFNSFSTTQTIYVKNVFTVGTVTLDDTPTVGKQVQAVTDGWDPAIDESWMNRLNYRWLINGYAVSDTPTFTPQPHHVGQQVHLEVHATGPNHKPSPVVSSAPHTIERGTLNWSAPVLPAQVRSGESLPNYSYSLAGTTFTWKADGEVVGTGEHFRPSGDLVGKELTLTISVDNPAYHPFQVTTDPRTITEGPIVLNDLWFTGTGKVGDPLAVRVWRKNIDEDPDYTYQWFVDGNLAGTGETYTPVAADLGKRVTATLTAAHDGYLDSAATDTPGWAVVTAGDLTVGTVRIDGAARVGATLTAVPADWDKHATLTYQWHADGAPVGTGATYTVTTADLNKTITVTASAAASGYTTSGPVTSDPTGAVAEGTLPAGTITIIDGTNPAGGTVRPGRTLNAESSGWDAGASLTYQWRIDDKPAGTGKTFKVPAAAAGKTLTLAVTATATGYDPIERTVTVGRVLKDPTITARVVGATKNRAGWYRKPVTVRFTCTAGTGPITSCPKPVKVTNARNRTVTGTVRAADGGTATVRVRGIRVDTHRPKTAFRGAVHGRTYQTMPRPRCVARDTGSGVASCRVTRTVTRKPNGVRTVRFALVARDRAGNVNRRAIRIHVNPLRLAAPLVGERHLIRKGGTYTLSLVSHARPQLRYAAPHPWLPHGNGPKFRPVGKRDGKTVWAIRVRINSATWFTRNWSIGARAGSTLYVAKFHLRG